MFNKIQTDTSESEDLVKSKISGSAAAVLVKFMFSVNKINMVKGTPDILCKQWKITPWEFKCGIKDLKKQNLIRKYTAKEYMLNPDISYNGDDKRYYIIKHMWDKQTSIGLRE
jgi:hypothetical protein